MCEAIEDAPQLCNRLTQQLSIRGGNINLAVPESAELLIGRANLSQRAYKALKKSLQRSGVFLASYKATSDYIKGLDIGVVSTGCEISRECMCATTSCKETLRLLCSSKAMYDAMRFPTVEQGKRLLTCMQEKFPHLYQSSCVERPENRILLIRETGDNFRAAGRHRTEQDSFSILNIHHLVTSPFGQFLNGLWRGPETRRMLSAHLSATYAELEDCVRNGIMVTLPDGCQEVFNVIVFYVADLGHKTEVLGRVLATAKFGCPHCKKPLQAVATWSCSFNSGVSEAW